MHVLLRFILPLLLFARGFCFVGACEGDPASIVQNVSTIHGDYSQCEIDLSVAGPDPLILTRYYTSCDTLQAARFGGWRLQPQTHLRVNEKSPTEIFVGTPEGSYLTFIPSKKRGVFVVDSSKEICNTARGNCSALTNVKNHRLYYDEERNTFELILSFGGKRIYVQNGSSPDFSLSSEILPSGNRITYEYDAEYRIKRIVMSNSSGKKTISWISFQHGEEIIATASDGKYVSYQFEEKQFLYPLLVAVSGSSIAKRQYTYDLRGDHALLTRKELPGGRATEIEYEQTQPYRVSQVAIPLNEETKSSYTFFYENSMTKVAGPNSCQANHIYDENKRLSAVEELLQGVLYRVKRRTWDGINLIGETLEDHSGRRLYAKTYAYDEFGNVTKEEEHGNFSGLAKDELETCTKRYSYQSTEKERTVSTIDQKATGIIKRYAPYTSIILSEETYRKGILKDRTLYRYDSYGALVKVITENHDDSQTKKVLTKIFTTKKELPNLGAPVVIEESISDGNIANGLLTWKTVNHFNKDGYVLRQEVYGREETYLYTIENQFDDAGRLTSTKRCSGQQTRYEYDEYGNLIKEERPEVATEYKYDLQNHIIAIFKNGKDGSSEKNTFSYDLNGNKISETDPLGNVTCFSYDSLGRCISKRENVSGHVWTYAYNALDQSVQTTDPLGNIFKSEYNTRGNLTYAEAPDGNKEFFTYTIEGSLYRHVDAFGIAKIYAYDYLGRIVSCDHFVKEENKPIDQEWYRYEAGKLVSENSQKGRIQYWYNQFGDLISKKIASKDAAVTYLTGKITNIDDGHLTEFEYDMQGQRIAVKKWKDTTHFSLYKTDRGPTGRITCQRIENERGQTLFKKEFVYTQSGNLHQEIGYPEGKKSVLAEYTHDSFDRLTRVTKGEATWTISYQNGPGYIEKTIKDPNGEISIKRYGKDGQILSHTLQQQEEIYSYDPLGRLTSERRGDLTLSTQYDLNTITSINPWEQKGDHKTLIYNSSGQLLKETLPGFTKPIEYLYDDRGHRKCIYFQNKPQEDYTVYTSHYDEKLKTVDTSYEDLFDLETTYDSSHHVQKEITKDEWGKFRIGFKYDKEGNLTKIILPDHSTIHYTYDGPFVSKIKRLSKLKQPLYSYEVLERDLMGNILLERLPEKLGTRKTTYGTVGRCAAIDSPHFSQKVTYEKLGNILEDTTIIDSIKYNVQFSYDSLSQLISENETKYTYDTLQNLISKNQSLITNVHAQTTKTEHFTCTYDPCGNLNELSESYGSLQLRFDALGRLYKSKNATGPVFTYTYDLDGRRLNKSSQGSTERFFYLGEYELGSVDKNGNIISLRIPLNPNAPDTTSIFSIELKTEAYIPFTDIQNNIRCLVNLKENKVVEKYEYTAFGQESIFSAKGKITASAINNPWRYQGKRSDPETNLIYFGARYYSPKLHKWISPDPLGSIDSINPYLYCHNNPYRYHDSWGFTAVDPSCGCIHHNHPGYANGPSNCICICGKYAGRRSGVITQAAGFALDTLNSPSFQASMQILAGAGEIAAGIGVTALSGGFAIPASMVITTHGIDQTLAGISALLSGQPTNTLSEHMLQKVGMNPSLSSTTNDMATLVFTLGAAGAIQSSRHFLTTLRLPSVQTTPGGAYNRATFERYKDLLRAQMERPHVHDDKLLKYINVIYKPQAQIGSGSTAAAIRHELFSGNRVMGKLHSQKGSNMITCLEKWVRNNPLATPGDKAAAENIIRDLRNALGR